MSNGPKEIYLITRDEDGEPIDPHGCEGWLWCEDDTTGCAVRYVRADEIERLRKDLSDSSAEIVMNHDEIERLRERIITLHEPIERIAHYRIKEHKGQGHYCVYRSAVDGMKALAMNTLEADDE